ncbi:MULTISPECIES: metal ABC transporter substrate-binding protein [unclassified Ketobacter]|uniref:metal ABC transporter substrate-binding protein n=1 Tax=unclassified Ketobacter TaxID=2639109 RepID=UPI000F2709D7|nr:MULTISPECIES: zinc ABC transporter substrate-binding protein [unclassified Ketobacter]RLT88127.1 MAG: zinc ABC transporter substrate-binding protein [Ketobacter sp. GenoA1]RLT93171.1 MAG: zinc ABC transporter substrate-binding protein [Ketobacter sp.]
MKTLTFLIALLFPLLCRAELAVFACEPEWAELTRQLGGSRVSVFAATNALQAPHHIEARPSLIARMRNADLVVCTGAELEVGWLPLLLRRSGNPKVQTNQPGYFEAAMVVERLAIPTTLDRTQGDVHAAGNPHVHLDPRRLLTIARALAQRLMELDPEGEPQYRDRIDAFASEWQRRMAAWESRATPLQGAQVVVQHEDWIYFNDWLALNQVATIEPKPGIPPSAADQKRLLNTLSQQPPQLIMLSAYQNDKAARWLADKLQVPVVVLPFTVGADEHSATLPALFDRTLSLLLQAHAQTADH